jgi:hypothetical protein
MIENFCRDFAATQKFSNFGRAFFAKNQSSGPGGPVPDLRKEFFVSL